MNFKVDKTNTMFFETKEMFNRTIKESQDISLNAIKASDDIKLDTQNQITKQKTQLGKIEHKLGLIDSFQDKQRQGFTQLELKDNELKNEFENLDMDLNRKLKHFQKFMMEK